jgi:GT2 family glycosyltransferase
MFEFLGGHNQADWINGTLKSDHSDTPGLDRSLAGSAYSRTMFEFLDAPNQRDKTNDPSAADTANPSPSATDPFGTAPSGPAAAPANPPPSATAPSHPSTNLIKMRMRTRRGAHQNSEAPPPPPPPPRFKKTPARPTHPRTPHPTPPSDFLILLDDDTFLETETIRRAVLFAALATRPVVVGGQMFDLNRPSVLASYAETVDPRTTWWGPIPGTEKDFDFAKFPLSATPWLHQIYRPDFNGWWMCLIPREILNHVGLSLPFFIKWDDAEFGLRVKHAGFEVVSLPGFGIWHQAWDDKADARNWQSFYHWRNRLIVALFYNPKRRPTALLRWLLVHDLFALLSLRYSAVQLHLDAIASLETCLDSDPDTSLEALYADLAERLPLIQQTQAQFIDAQEFAFDPDDFPSKTRIITDYRMSRLRKIFCLIKSAILQILPSPRRRNAPPKLIVHTRPTRWIRVASVSSAVVVSPDGLNAVRLIRDRRQFWKLFGSTWKTYLKLFRKWPKLRKFYRQSPRFWSSIPVVSVPRQLASFQNWQTLFSKFPPH